MPTIDGWTAEHADAIRSLAGVPVAPADRERSPEAIAAAATGGLPVYCDMGGCLAITAKGEVVEYLFEDAVVRTVSDPSSLRLARVAAAEKYLQLASLMPTDGITCAPCGGSGRIGAMQSRCAACDGTGLVSA